MKITFVIALHNIDIKENLGRGDKLNDVTFISNDNSVIRNLIPSNAAGIIGKLEYQGLIESNVFIYSIENLPNDVTPENYLIDRLFYLQSFLSAAWLLKDNNIDFELGFAFYESEGRKGISSNYLALAYSMSNGGNEVTKINRDELREVRKIHRERLRYERNSHATRKETQLLKGNSRVEMALYHIQCARTEIDVGIKISFYCSALEALFSTSQAELAHQLSERLAFYISNAPKERFDIYKKSKQAYGTRSKIVHSASIKENDLEKIKNLAIFCDSSLRKVMYKLVLNNQDSVIFGRNNTVLDEHMLKLIFGINEDVQP